MKKQQNQELYKKLEKIYLIFIYITDTLALFILSYAMLTEWYNRGMSSMSWLILGLLFFITGLRTMLKKTPIFVPLFKETRTMLFNFAFSLQILTQWLSQRYDYGRPAIDLLIGGLLFFIIGVIIGVRKILNKPSLGKLLEQLRTRYKS